MRTDSSKNTVLYDRLKTLCKCYSFGQFEALFPYLSDSCVFESQWVLSAMTEKGTIMDYLTGKGETLRRANCCPKCMIVELIGNLNMIKNADVHINGGKPQRASLGLWYPEGKLAMLMRQETNGQNVSVLVDIQLDENDLISRIDLCMPELFRFRRFAGLFDSDDDRPLKQDVIEQVVRNLLIANPEDFKELDEFIIVHASEYPGDLTAFAFDLAEQMGNATYCEEHIDTRVSAADR